MNHARVRQLISERSIPVTESGCWLWTHGESSGYGSLRTKERLYGAHRASYEAFVGPIPDGMCVCHKCDVRLCVNPEHFFIGDRAANNADARAKGRNPRPKQRPRGLKYKRKLSHLDVRCREMSAAGMSLRAIGRELGVTHHTVKRCLNA